MGTSNCLKQGQAGWKVFCRGVAALLVDGEKSELLKCEDMSEALMHETVRRAHRPSQRGCVHTGTVCVV